MVPQIPACHTEPCTQYLTSGPELSITHPHPASTYLFVTFTQQSLEKQHQLGERGPDLKLLLPALLHDLVAGEGHKGQGLRHKVQREGSCHPGTRRARKELGEGRWVGAVSPLPHLRLPWGSPPSTPSSGVPWGWPHLGEYRTQVWLVVFIPSAQWLLLTGRACDTS